MPQAYAAEGSDTFSSVSDLSTTRMCHQFKDLIVGLPALRG
jgi:hypothetical protein